MENQNLYLLKKGFLEEWPLTRIYNLNLEEYTNLDKTSFTYWLESKTTDLGSIWGGSSYKFGIYKRRDVITEVQEGHRKTDGEYAWFTKYGNTAEEAFLKVREIIISIIENVQDNNLEAIDAIDLGDAYKWKIAFLYGDFNVVNIFTQEALKFIADYLGYMGDDFSFSTLNRYILKQKGEEDYFRFTARLWKEFESPSVEVSDDVEDPHKLNQIFFGPPGTGKTFNSVNEALKIIDPGFYNQHKENRPKLRERFSELLISNWMEPKGQIGFCTFHQSFTYEDFVEGIKPSLETEELSYKIEDGIFKSVCNLANSSKSSTKVKKEGQISWNRYVFEKRKPHFFKLSLGEANNPEDREIYEFCIENGYISIGFGGNVDFSGKTESEIKEICKEVDDNSSAGSQLSTFIHGLRKDTFVIISKGNHFIRALGRIVGDYEFHDDFPIRYNHFRKVEWLLKDENIPVKDIYKENLTQRSIYKIDQDKLVMDFFVKDGQESITEETQVKPYVLIIDEINRGNISSIFGELITLIEKDKRAGGPEELEVTLPYSKETFKVPDNVYLLGTMNTADKSIEALDTALRRRFSFREFPPQPELIEKVSASGKLNGLVESVNLKELLLTLNNRIEKLIDKDHKIGHSYFLKVDSLDKLKAVFKDEIIPLLEEYFFGDYGKIGLVLGSSFIEKVDGKFEFADFKDYALDLQQDLKEKPVFKIREEHFWDFNKI